MNDGLPQHDRTPPHMRRFPLRQTAAQPFARRRARVSPHLVLPAVGALGRRLHARDAAVVQVAPQRLADPLGALDALAVGGAGAEAEAALMVGVVHGTRGELGEAVLHLGGLVLQASAPVAAAGGVRDRRRS